MRTPERWEEVVRPQILKKLTPRLQKDLDLYKDRPQLPLDSYYLYGPPGGGKTAVAADLFLEAHKQKYLGNLSGGIIWVTFYDMLKEIQRAMKFPQVEEPLPGVQEIMDEFAALERYQKIQYLFLDDVGDVKFTDWNISQLQVLISYRYEHLLPIVITSNHNLDELAEISDGRIASRINRMCLIHNIE